MFTLTLHHFVISSPHTGHCSKETCRMKRGPATFKNKIYARENYCSKTKLPNQIQNVPIWCVQFPLCSRRGVSQGSFRSPTLVHIYINARQPEVLYSIGGTKQTSVLLTEIVNYELPKWFSLAIELNTWWFCKFVKKMLFIARLKLMNSISDNDFHKPTR